MIDLVTFNKNIKKGDIKNIYLFCGDDEKNIKESVEKIVNKCLNKEFYELNYVEIDGQTIDPQKLINACETLPFMSDKKVVLVYRADFFRDDCDKNSEKSYKEIKKYIEEIQKDCVLIFYYIFSNAREKESRKVKSLDKKIEVVKIGKLKGRFLEDKVKEMFLEKGKDIKKLELAVFCSYVQNNLDIIENEVDKLCAYTENENITRKDIDALVSRKSENDIFNLVDFLSKRDPNGAIDILDELIFKGEAVNSILYMIERQMRLLTQIRVGIDNGKNSGVLAKELKLNSYICDKMVTQSRKFSFTYLKKCLEECIETEKRLKSVSVNTKTELEFLIMKITVL
ncbi:DNA polymerase III subunit delta [Clostridium sp. DL1XJH146]